MRAVKCSPRPWPSLGLTATGRSSAQRVRRSRRSVRNGLAQTYSVGAPSVLVTGVAWFVILLAAWVGVAGVWLGQQTPSATLLAGGVLGSVATVACAVGMLRRLDWARRSVIGLLGLVIAAHLAGLWLQHERLHTLLGQALAHVALPVRLIELLGGQGVLARGLTVLMALAACGLLLWLVRGLMTPAVRQEFA